MPVMSSDFQRSKPGGRFSPAEVQPKWLHSYKKGRRKPITSYAKYYVTDSGVDYSQWFYHKSVKQPAKPEYDTAH